MTTFEQAYKAVLEGQLEEFITVNNVKVSNDINYKPLENDPTSVVAVIRTGPGTKSIMAGNDLTTTTFTVTLLCPANDLQTILAAINSLIWNYNGVWSSLSINIYNATTDVAGDRTFNYRPVFASPFQLGTQQDVKTANETIKVATILWSVTVGYSSTAEVKPSTYYLSTGLATHVAAANGTGATGASTIIVANAIAALYTIGQTIGIGTTVCGGEIANGRVIILKTVGASNTTITFNGSSVSTLTGHYLYPMHPLNYASHEFVSHPTYEPATLDGESIPVLYKVSDTVTFTFTLLKSLTGVDAFHDLLHSEFMKASTLLLSAYTLKLCEGLTTKIAIQSYDITEVHENGATIIRLTLSR